MHNDPDDLPEFHNPPVIEVVCGILFQELSSLHGVQLGNFWDKLKPGYDHSKEVAPLAPAIEQFDPPKPLTLTISDIPPLPRTWLMTPKENGIVQVQRDRFLHNWKKVEATDEYPRYKEVIAMFKERLATFEEFLADNEIGSIDSVQYEMTYVNHILQGDGWNSLEEVGNIFPDFVYRRGASRFLDRAEQVNWRTSYVLPEKQGRLHAVVRSAIRSTDRKLMLLFELTTRGIPQQKCRQAMWNWFDLGHRWIVKAFEDLTSDSVRKELWKQSTLVCD
jgi:uncharacterized protein (TIGR04255 family)